MKTFVKQAMLFVALATAQNVYSSIVNISNKTLFNVRASLDVVMYPDPQREIGSNSTISENIGVFLMRGITIGVHVGDQFVENILSESLSQTLGLGDIDYHIFAEIKNLGRGKFVDEIVLELTFYLIRGPKFLYSGGIVSTSKTITVFTRNMETFKIVDQDYINSCAVCVPETRYILVQPISTDSSKVAFGGTVVR